MKESTLIKHKKIIDEWFNNGFNGTKAYQKFYPKSKPESADSSFREMVENSRVKAYIKEKEEIAKKELRITHLSVLRELKNWAYSDITQTISLTPSEIENLPEEIKRLITRFKKTTRRIGEEMTEETIELHFVSKEKAMEMINKHIGFYGEHNTQKLPNLSDSERKARIKQLKDKLTK